MNDSINNYLNNLKMEIDICLATKNSFSTLPSILHSIRNQTYFDNTRLLVADNKSNDGTLNELKKYHAEYKLN